MHKPLFSPKSVFWRVNREVASALAAPRAVLMQIAHPLVAAGVAEHSQFRKHRLARLYRTSLAAAAITFGNRDFALRAARSINRKHQLVHGYLKADSGIFPAGTRYDANDPELKLWVLSTITDSTLLVYETFVAKLSREDRRHYYEESLKAGELFGIPEEIMPASYEGFEAYMRQMLDGDVIRVGDEAREITRALFSRSFSGSLLRVGSAIGIRLLPERLKREFEFESHGMSEESWTRISSMTRRIRRYTPSILCANPAAAVSELLLYAQPRPRSSV